MVIHCENIRPGPLEQSNAIICSQSRSRQYSITAIPEISHIDINPSIK
jgi:hypothetical protein